MRNGIKAIDFMYYVATPEFIAKWNEAKKGELICRMEKAIGGLPQYDSIEAMIAKMDEAGVDRVFITQCKMWSYRNKWMYMDTKLWRKWRNTRNAIRTASSALPATIPFASKSRCRSSNRRSKCYGFKGVYIHIYGFDIPLHDAKMYPLYAKCDELKVPVSMQVGHVLEAMPSEHARPIYLDRIASDFPDLKIIGAHTGWPWVEELISVCYKWDNVYFGVDAWMPKYMKPEIIHYINSRMGQDRCLWGTNGLPWKESLDQWEELGLKEATKKKLLRDNAVELFGLSQ